MANKRKKSRRRKSRRRNKSKPGRKYKLLLYQQRFRALRPPALLLAMMSYLVWLMAFRIAVLNSTPGWMYSLGWPLLRIWGDLLLLVIVAAVVLYFGSGFIASRFAYVQCHRNHIVVRTPFFRFIIKYNLVSHIAPARFVALYPLKEQKSSQQRLLRPVLAKLAASEGTVMQLELTKYPGDERWLRYLVNPYMFSPNTTGLLFLVINWMSLSNDLEKYRNAWRERRARRRKAQDNVSLYNRLR